MFEDVRLPSILMPAILVIGVAFFILKMRSKRTIDDAQYALERLKYMTIGTGVLLVLLLFCLPSTPALGTFGRPETIEDIQAPKHLLAYLQTYNKALVRTTEVLYWFLFVFVWWFLAALYTATKALGKVEVARGAVEASAES